MKLNEVFRIHEAGEPFPKELLPYAAKIKRNILKMYQNNDPAAESAARALLLQVGQSGANNLFIRLANMPGDKRAQFVADALKLGAPPGEQPKKTKAAPTPKPTPAEKPKSKLPDEDDDEEDEADLGPDMDYEDPTADKSSQDDEDDWDADIKAKSKADKKPAAPKAALPPPSLPTARLTGDDEGSDEVEFSIPASHKKAVDSGSDDDVKLTKADREMFSQQMAKYKADFAAKNVKSFKDMSPEEQEKMKQLYGGPKAPKMTDTFGLKPTGKSKNVGPSF